MMNENRSVDFSQYPEETLCRWVYQLNTWQWPSDYPKPTPDGFDGLPNRVHMSDQPVDKHYFVSAEMDAIEQLVDRKTSLQWFHINVLEMTKEQSDDFTNMQGSEAYYNKYANYYLNKRGDHKRGERIKKKWQNGRITSTS